LFTTDQVKATQSRPPLPLDAVGSIIILSHFPIDSDVESDRDGEIAPVGAVTIAVLLAAYVQTSDVGQIAVLILLLRDINVAPGTIVADDDSVAITNVDDDQTHDDVSSPRNENNSEQRYEAATLFKTVTALSVAESNEIRIIRPSVVKVAEANLGGVGAVARLRT
jgi:hypothetical protein